MSLLRLNSDVYSQIIATATDIGIKMVLVQTLV